MELATRKGRHARPRERRNLRERAQGPLLGACVAVIEFGAAFLATWSVTLAVSVAAGVALIVAIIISPTLLTAAAFPASFATWRVGPAAVDLSVADLIALLGTVAALPHVPWHSRTFRRVLGVALGYSGVVSLAVIAHYSTSGAVEVVHRFMMVMGGVCIGAAVVRTGKVMTALRALVVMALVVAVAAIWDTLTHDLRPAYALGMQKNASGTLLVSTILVVFFAEKHLRWPRSFVMPVGLVLLCGLAASQSRGAGLALAAAFVVFIVRRPGNGAGGAWQRSCR